MDESEFDYRFLVETILPPPSYCPKCGTVANLYKHGKKKQLFFDLPMHAKRVGIYIKPSVINVESATYRLDSRSRLRRSFLRFM
ncbi:transposase family protein [Bacillus sp. J14TS2]|uniref:transposase family protein n=1 Tax=Bacillus sp. J14TS2 TaxID=2807188 RepID=UPI0035B54AE9